MLENDFAALVDYVLPRPILIPIGFPCCKFVVLGNWISDAVTADCCLDSRGGSLERKFWRVNADHNQSAIFIFVVQAGDMRQGAHAVYASRGPEIDQHDFATQIR